MPGPAGRSSPARPAGSVNVGRVSLRSGLIERHADVRARLLEEVGGPNPRLRITDATTLSDIRQHIKNVYRSDLVDRIIARGATPVASHDELLRLTASMNPADRGSIGELWYERVVLVDRDVRPQVAITIDGRGRRFDFVDVDVAARTSHEVKIGRRIRTHDREQFIDMANAVRDRIPVTVGDETFVLRRHTVALLNPEAARGDWSWLLRRAADYPTQVEFVLYAPGGRSYRLSGATLDAWESSGRSFASFDDWVGAGAPGAVP